jgi:type IV pilus assembly protein PilY1
VVYVGANDGMLHAFNGGFYKTTSKSFVTQLGSETAFELGQELWAYVPYNLLPHLYWLTERDYGKQLHVSYMDSKPRIFDARVFFKPDGTPSDNHPDGWGTLLVAGMRFGGGLIRSDLDKTDGDLFVSGTDRTMTSAYVIMDITNPEVAPTVLAEITMPRQGFTTCYPTAMPMSSAGATTSENNQWYLVFGSGPADAAGKATPEKIERAVSDQAGQLYVLDLKELVSQKKIVTLEGSSKQFKEGAFTFATTESGSFISDPIAVDLDIGTSNKTPQFKADAVYYGTVAGDEENGRGTMRRLLTGNELPDSSGSVNWTGDSLLINVQQPISAAPSAAVDDKKRLWIYFGAGRFFNRSDIEQNGTMEFYGIREPIDNSTGSLTWSTVDTSNLYNSTEITLDNGTCVNGAYTASCVGVKKSGVRLGDANNPDWLKLISEVDKKDGWRHSMPDQWERVLGQAAVLGGVTLFTSYTPSENLCEFEGTSDLWALYYKTGTPYYIPILKGTTGDFAKSVSLGKGLALTPNIHVGESGTSKAFIQTSTGAIETVEIVNPINFKSGTLFWRQNTE